jgi:hypothetical protein
VRLLCILLPVAALFLVLLTTYFRVYQPRNKPNAASELLSPVQPILSQSGADEFESQRLSELNARLIQAEQKREVAQAALDSCVKELVEIKGTLKSSNLELANALARGEPKQPVQPVQAAATLRGGGNTKGNGDGEKFDLIAPPLVRADGNGQPILGASASASGASASASGASVRAIVQPAEFGFMIPSGRRPKGKFYAGNTILALQRGGVPSSSVLVFNAEGDGQHPELENMRDSTLVNAKYQIHWLSRPAGTSFAMAPEWTSVSMPALSTSQYVQAATDDPNRRRWRTKEAQDFMFVARRALELFGDTKWFVFLQDDAVYRGPENQLTDKLRTIIAKPAVLKNGFAHINPFGNVALLMHRSLLISFLGFAELRFHLIPIDWLLSEFLEQTLGIVEKLTEVQGNRVFTHVGKVSTHEGNALRKMT